MHEVLHVIDLPQTIGSILNFFVQEVSKFFKWAQINIHFTLENILNQLLAQKTTNLYDATLLLVLESIKQLEIGKISRRTLSKHRHVTLILYLGTMQCFISCKGHAQINSLAINLVDDNKRLILILNRYADQF